MDKRSPDVAGKRRQRQHEKKASQKIVGWVLGILFAVLVIVGLMGYRMSIPPYSQSTLMAKQALM